VSSVPERVSPSPPEAGPPSPLSERVRSLRLPETSSGGSAGGWIAWGLCLVFAASTAVLAWLLVGQRTEEAAAAKQDPAAAAVATVEGPTGADRKAAGAIALDSKGYIIARHQILVSPKVSGMIVKSSILEGIRVKKGDVLAELENTDYKADCDRAKAFLEAARQKLAELERGFRPEEIAQAKAELSESEAQLVQWESSWKRASALIKTSDISDTDFEEAESRYRAMQRRVERLRFALKLIEDGPRIERKLASQAELRQAEAELAKAQWRLDNCTIRAPISGTILKKNAEEGNVVNPIAFNGSFSLCDLADLADLEVDMSIQERDIARVFQGQKCKIRAEAFPDRVYEGEVSRIMPIADRAKGAVSVRVKVIVPAEEEGVYLKPEMGAIVSFLGEKPAGG